MHRDAQLLQHEQLHFDLAEIATRKIRQTFAELKGSCAGEGGSETVQQAVTQIQRDLEDEQRRYDRETAHGTNEAAHAQWFGRVRKLLQ